MHTFAVSQFGERLLPRRSDGKYLYANVIAYLFKGPEEFSYDWEEYTFIGSKVTEQERDTYIEVLDAETGYYWLYIDITWQPETFKWLKKDLTFSVNSYGVGKVDFTDDIAF